MQKKLTSLDTDSLLYESTLLGNGITPGFAKAMRRFAHGQGVYLYDEGGKEYIDFCAGTFTNSIGHGHPKAVEFMQARISEPWNIHDYSTPYRLPLLNNLNALTPDAIDTFQFYTGGSETVEAGLRAIQSFLSNSGSRKSNFATFQGNYHGKTLKSRELIHWGFPLEIPSTIIQLPFPDKFGLSSQEKIDYENQCLEIIEEAFKEKSIGAVICESILGAGGTLHASNKFWAEFENLRRTYNVLLFADEICVGFGRTGADFGFQKAGIEPDIISFAKGIGGGFPAMVLAGKQEIMNALPFGEPGGASTTFSGNPLSVAAMYVTTEIYREENLLANVQLLESPLASWLEYLSDRYTEIFDHRTFGLMGTLCLQNAQGELSRDNALKLHAACIDKGVFLMTFNHLIRIMPPLIITEPEIDCAIRRLESALDAVFK